MGKMLHSVNRQHCRVFAVYITHFTIRWALEAAMQIIINAAQQTLPIHTNRSNLPESLGTYTAFLGEDGMVQMQ